MANCLVSLGSNLGERSAELRAALQLIQSIPQTSLLAHSSVHDTKPAGGPQQAEYLNAVARLETSLTPQQLLAELQRIENELGRVREERWGPRTIDLDLLLFDQVESESPELTIPHPRMAFRRFVLEPAAEIAAEMVYPINGWTIERLLRYSRESQAEINLAPGRSEWCPNSLTTELLQSLQTEPDVQPLFQWQIEQGLFDSPKVPQRPAASWFIFDSWPVQMGLERFANAPDFDERLAAELRSGVKPRLVVVWHPDDAPIMPLLARARRHRECPPLLWVPQAPFEQARAEVIAAMAAMA